MKKSIAGLHPAPDRATNRQIDQLVRELYGLTKEEMAVVEGRV